MAVMLRTPQRPWRQSAYYFSVATLTIFLVNLSFTIWASTRDESQVQDGVGILTEQSCSGVKSINTVLHVLINVISATILAGSNYCMQCLIAPTRPQIDAAHKNGKWLDIGGSSLRNFFSISWRNRVVWLLLCISSLPLHLLYNSTIIASTSTNHYWVYALPETTLLERNTTEALDAKGIAEGERLFDMIYDGTLANTTLTQFFEQYAEPLQSGHGTLAFVIADDNYTTSQFLTDHATFGWPSTIDNTYGVTSTNWIVDRNQEKIEGSYDRILKVLRDDPLQWVNPFGVPSSGIKAIYSQATEEHCKLLFNRTLCWIVTALNLLKGVLMLYVAFGSFDSPILTLGDSVASFLQRQDPYTESMCLKPRNSFSKKKGFWDRTPEPLKRKRTLKFAAVRRRRLCASLLILLICIAGCIYLLFLGLWFLPLKNLREWGLGAIHEDTLMNVTIGSGGASLLTNILLANAPQVVMSIIYVAYNSAFTGLCAAIEWNSYGIQRKGLRVTSKPQGAQRETYFLQLPYRWSLPLIVISGLLHWLISQSIFVVILQSYAAPEEDKFDLRPAELLSYVAIGWSPLGFILVIAGAFLIIVALCGAVLMPLPFSGIPKAAGNSAVISAACHPSLDEKNVWEKPLKWGAVNSGYAGQEGHCCFSSDEVQVPQPGMMYS